MFFFVVKKERNGGFGAHTAVLCKNKMKSMRPPPLRNMKLCKEDTKFVKVIPTVQNYQESMQTLHKN